jgi:hypothetical protein
MVQRQQYKYMVQYNKMVQDSITNTWFNTIKLYKIASQRLHDFDMDFATLNDHTRLAYQPTFGLQFVAYGLPCPYGLLLVGFVSGLVGWSKSPPV